MKHTATGCSAFDNPLEYRPTKKDGTPKEYYRSAYRRPKWNDAFPCILRESDGMGGMITCHPGRKLADGTYSDARAYTVLELLRAVGKEGQLRLLVLHQCKLAHDHAGGAGVADS